MTTLQKPSSGVRGIVVGDIVRKLVGRIMAQQMSDAIKAATAPFQCVLSTRTDTECIAHALQAISELNPKTTIFSVNGIGAFDLVSRKKKGWKLSSVAVRPHVLWHSFAIFLGRRRKHDPLD